MEDGYKDGGGGGKEREGEIERKEKKDGRKEKMTMR